MKSLIPFNLKSGCVISCISVTHRHFLQVVVVIADGQAVELLLQLPHPLVVQVT